MWIFRYTDPFIFQSDPVLRDGLFPYHNATFYCTVSWAQSTSDNKEGYMYRLSEGWDAQYTNSLCASQGVSVATAAMIGADLSIFDCWIGARWQGYEIIQSDNSIVSLSRIRELGYDFEPTSPEGCLAFTSPNKLTSINCNLPRRPLCRKPPQECHSYLSCGDFWEMNYPENPWNDWHLHFNYDAYYSSIMVIWTLMIQNDWYVVMNAGELLYEGNSLFVKWYFILVVLSFEIFVTNIVAAFILRAHQSISTSRQFVTGDLVQGKTYEGDWCDCEIEEVLPGDEYQVYWMEDGLNEDPLQKKIMTETDLRQKEVHDHGEALHRVANPRNPPVTHFNRNMFNVVPEDREAFRDLNRHVALII